MINVCLSTDDNYAPYAGVVIASVLKNSNPEDKLSFYILDGGIEEENKNKIKSLSSIKNCQIHFVPIDRSKYDVFKNIQTHKYLSIAAYYRLKLPSQIPNVKKIIYLDCDTVVNTSLKDFFNQDLGENYIAGVIDIRVKYKPKWKNEKYINSGVLLMDLDKMRSNNIEEFLEKYTVENIENIKCGDQDIINFALKDKIKIIENPWNVQVSSFLSRSDFTKSPNIIHYVAAKKPWHYGSYSYFKEKYFEYLSLTPWAIPQKDKFKWTVLNEICSIYNFIIDKPTFIFRPKFWEAVWSTIIEK